MAIKNFNKNTSSEVNYEDLLAQQKSRLENSNIKDQLKLAMETENRINTIYERMAKEAKKTVNPEYSYPKMGNIIGILRFIQQNPQVRNKLFNITGLNNGIMQLYRQCGGQLPYVTKTGRKEYGYAQDSATLRELLYFVADKLKVYITDQDMEEITQEKWDELYKEKLEEMEHNAKFSKNVVNYEE